MKFSNKIVLDFIPFVIVCLSAIISLLMRVNSDYVTQWQHYMAFGFLVINVIIFYKNHQLGVLFLGLMLILGIIGILSFNVGVNRSSLNWTPFGFRIPLFMGNPIILIYLIIHFLLSGRYYVGIMTSQYWRMLFNNKNAEG